MLALGGSPGRRQHQAEAELQRAGADAEDGEPAAGALRAGRRVEDDAVGPDDVERTGHEVHVLGDRVERAGEGGGAAGGDDVGVERREPGEVAAVDGERLEVGHRRRVGAQQQRLPGRHQAEADEPGLAQRRGPGDDQAEALRRGGEAGGVLRAARAPTATTSQRVGEQAVGSRPEVSVTWSASPSRAATVASVPCSDSARKASALVGVGSPARSSPVDDPGRHVGQLRTAEVARRHGEDAAGGFGDGLDPLLDGAHGGPLLQPGRGQRHDGGEREPEREEQPGSGAVAGSRPGQAGPGAHPSSSVRPVGGTRERHLTTNGVSVVSIERDGSNRAGGSRRRRTSPRCRTS